MADSNTPILDLLDMETGSHDNDWGDQVDAIFLLLENAMKASRATATTGGTTTLTKSTAKELLQRITGTLSSNAVIEVPNVASRWIFSNETTGAYTVTVKVSGQTGVVVPQGSAMLLRGNGTDVVAVNSAQPRGLDQKATAVGGTADALNLTMSPAMTSYTPGAIVRWTSPGANTVTNPTANASGLGTLTIKKGLNAALAVGDTGGSGYLCQGEINSDASAIILQNPATEAVTIATAAQFRANTANKVLSTDGVWSAAEPVALTDAATVAVDMSAGLNFKLTIGGNRTLGQPTNQKKGQSGVITITQDGTGSRTLAFHSSYKWPGGTDGVLSTAAGAKDSLKYYVHDTDVIELSLAKGLA